MSVVGGEERMVVRVRLVVEVVLEGEETTGDCCRCGWSDGWWWWQHFFHVCVVFDFGCNKSGKTMRRR